MRSAAAAIVLMLVLGACGGDSDESNSETPEGVTADATDDSDDSSDDGGDDDSSDGGGELGGGELPGDLDDLGDESGTITYTLPDGGLFRVAAQDGAEPENLGDSLDGLAPGGGDEWVSASPDGEWLLISSERFDCEGWACLTVVDADVSEAEPVEIDGEPLRVSAVSALGPGGDLIVYSSEEGPHESDLWATSREGDDWTSPVLLTDAVESDFSHTPALSDDGSAVLFDCGPEPYTSAGTGICRVSVDGSDLTTLVAPEDGPGGSADNALHSADFESEGTVLFEADWLGGEALWRVDADGGNPTLVNGAFANDNSPCVLPNGRIASLWLERPDTEGYHELKVMAPEGNGYFMVVIDIDVADIGLGCSA